MTDYKARLIKKAEEEKAEEGRFVANPNQSTKVSYQFRHETRREEEEFSEQIEPRKVAEISPLQ